jgi:all-trans-retinol dehydrogenase (NAD+)
MTKIKNKTILVTGGAGGMGKLLALRCLQKGAKQVILWDINEEQLNKTTAELEQRTYKVHPYVVDVCQIKDIEWAAKDILNNIGKVDIVFNNAGIVVGKSFAEHSDDEMKKTIDINVLGVMRTTKAFIGAMLADGSGHIVNIASAAGLIPNPNMSVYASSKWAVVGWSESLRLELEDLEGELRVLTVTPGYINTGMFDGVKAPILTPIMQPDDIVNRIIKAVESNEIILRAPFIVNSVPLLRGILPTRVFDKIADTLGVYGSMDEFKGRA